MSLTDEGKIQKRKYSRNGCAECKKRRMKCDEMKPKCWQCSRLNRECVYVLNPKNKKRISKTVVEEQSQQIPSIINDINTKFSPTDANLLYNDLNEIVNWRLEEALTPGLKSYIESEPFNTQLEQLPTSINLNQIVFNVPITNFNLGSPHNRYFERFYNEFCELVSPFNPNINSNPLRDILLHYSQKEPYLMYAILACGGQSLHHITNSIQDDQAYCSYLSSCVNILGEQFENDNSVSNYKIEPILLTILLLTSDSASSKNVKWRTHLNGAKLLLQKTTIESDILNFCKNWLITYEVLAGITNPFGGIFQKNEIELDNFITNDQSYLNSLKRLNMLDINDFNYLSGHMIKLDLIFKDLINILNRLRKHKIELSKNSHLNDSFKPKLISIDEIIEIEKDLHDCEQMYVIDKSGFITESNLNHPSHNKLIKNFNNIDTILKTNGESVTMSWFDISHQSHVIVARLILLTKILEISKYSVLIQDLVRKSLSFLNFLNFIDVKQYKNKCAAHLHLLIDIVGRNCIYDEDKRLTETFLNLLNSFGLASSMFNLTKLKKIWNNEELDQEEDVLTW